MHTVVLNLNGQHNLGLSRDSDALGQSDGFGSGSSGNPSNTH